MNTISISDSDESNFVLDVDISVSNLIYETNDLMIRATQGLFLFTVDIEYLSGLYPILELTSRNNFMAHYIYSQGPLPDWSSVNISGEGVYMTDPDYTARAGMKTNH